MADVLIVIVAMLMAGVIAGVLAGVLGVGGGIVVVPALELVLGFLGVPAEVRMHIAVGTSLAVIIPTSITSARAHHERGSVDIGLAKRWTAFILFGSIIGVIVASRVDGRVLTGLFGTIALLMAIQMALPFKEKTLSSSVPKGIITGIIPVTIGVVSAMMGIGGGTLSVPALTLMGTPIHRAVGTSALFGLLIAIPGAIGFVIAGWGNSQLPDGSLGFVNVAGFILIAPATVLAAPLGARLAHALNRRHLSMLFGLFLLLAAARMISRAVAG